MQRSGNVRGAGERDESDDWVDLIRYRQLHSPVLCRSPRVQRPLTVEEFAGFHVAACLTPGAAENGQSHLFRHPSATRSKRRRSGCKRHSSVCIESGRTEYGIGDLFHDVACVMDDLKLLHRNGLLEIRSMEARQFHESAELLNRLEARHGDYITNAHHTRWAVPSEWVETSVTSSRHRG